MRILPNTRSCFVCGEENPAGLKLKFESDGKVVKTEFITSPQHVGFQGVIHGGISSTVLDEIMVWACAVQTGKFAYCAELSVRFIQPIGPGEIIQALSEMTEDKRGRMFLAKAQLQSRDGLVYATATGKYIPIRKFDASALADFVTVPDFLKTD